MTKRCVMFLPLLGLLSACAVVPTGPNVMVLPGTGKPFDQFQVDDAVCGEHAQQQIGTSPGQASAHGVANSAALGTILGAAAGAAIGPPLVMPARERPSAPCQPENQ